METRGVDIASSYRFLDLSIFVDRFYVDVGGTDSRDDRGI